ncbi:uncharacterized protein MEPE_04342 [Melanopsichium pennsylvanicum]|uniref:Uncharacterized protein n=1 Tax=Melanopsichium pennsylvanicum TaxID=63383 RepID=A0AAJ5C6K4_9BASI|nr:uncharacterized protein MEPE_04342 [Melanopsichium pennsylvanicum]
MSWAFCSLSVMACLVFSLSVLDKTTRRLWNKLVSIGVAMHVLKEFPNVVDDLYPGNLHSTLSGSGGMVKPAFAKDIPESKRPDLHSILGTQASKGGLVNLSTGAAKSSNQFGI